MNPQFIYRLRFRNVLILANGIFWLVFAINFAAKSYAYHPHVKAFEEPSPPYIIFGRAFPFKDYMTPLMRTTRLLQWPSFIAAARPYFWYFNSHGIYGETLYHGISISGYYLIIVCVLSFLQWYAVGGLVDYVRKRLNLRPTRTPDNGGRTYDVEQ